MNPVLIKGCRGPLLALLFVLAGSAAHADTSVEELREPLFIEANNALTAANAVSANIWAPLSYSAGSEHYRKAEQTFRAGGSIDSITRSLAKSTESFATAATAAAAARERFASTLQARDDAESAEAATHSSNTWQDAEETLAEATTSLERGRENSATRNAGKAEALFREAELTAIKANYLNETRDLLEEADDLRAKKWAPVSFAAASQMVDQAETELTENRYDTDRPRSLAQEAKHQVKHAIYVSKLADRLDDRDTSLEAILLDWEKSFRRIAGELDVPIYFDEGHVQATDDIIAAIDAWNTERESLNNDIVDRDAQITALNAQIAGLQQQLGTESAEQQQLTELIAAQERNRQRFAEVEEMFPDDQAYVFRKGNTVIVRMIGLNFDSGAADLKPEHEGLLAIVQRAMAAFPQSNVVIEGHTDSFGSDAVNLELSQKRADAVRNYMLAANAIAADNITALGYGESKPVANNESSEGRRRNRRIDVVIYP